MGMSASQARLLSLTARLSDLELEAQSITNSKIRLADEAEAASRSYSEALDKQKLTVYSDRNSESSYIDATAYNLTTYNAVSDTDHQRFIKDGVGRVLVMSNVGANYDKAIASGFKTNLNDYLDGILGYHDQTTYNTRNGLPVNAPLPQEATAAITNYRTIYTNSNKDANSRIDATGQLNTFLQESLGYYDQTSATANGKTYDSGAILHYKNLFNEIKDSGGYNIPGDDKMKDSEWLQAQVSTGNIFLSIWDKYGGITGNGDFVAVSWTSGDPSIQEKDDKTELAKTEAKYDITMKDIEGKDKKFDLSLKEIDTEHNAIQTEIDSVKKVMDKNIDRSYKTFNG